MSTTRERARNAIRVIKAPMPTHGESTLWVEGIPVLKLDNHEYVRSMVARYAIRTALEKGCARIGVRHPHRTPLMFDVTDLLFDTVTRVGHWPVPKFRKVPVNFATVGMQSLGAEIARTRPLFTVPRAFAGSPLPGEK